MLTARITLFDSKTKIIKNFSEKYAYCDNYKSVIKVWTSGYKMCDCSRVNYFYPKGDMKFSCKQNRYILIDVDLELGKVEKSIIELIRNSPGIRPKDMIRYIDCKERTLRKKIVYLKNCGLIFCKKNSETDPQSKYYPVIFNFNSGEEVE